MGKIWSDTSPRMIYWWQTSILIGSHHHHDTAPRWNANNQETGAGGRETDLFRSRQLEKIVDSHGKDYLNNWMGGVLWGRRRKREGKKKEERNEKERVESSLLTTFKSTRSVQITGWRAANLPELTCVKVGLGLFWS